MLFYEFYSKAKDTCVRSDDFSGEFYLEPLYKILLAEEGLDVKDISDKEITLNDLKEMLELDVKKHNAIESRTREVMSWIWDIINSKVDPLVIDEQNDYIKNLTEYFKEKKDMITAELDKQAKSEEIKSKVNSQTPGSNMFNFSKRK
ncbi:MAG: hypothetical protein Q4A15_12515 [Prevotellaceae bacterium]|nr:hypothetical protein [Prevotellaceae bacterium]